MNAGMSSEAALNGLTPGGAKLVGMPATASALIRGAPADFVVWNGSPLDLRCRPSHVVVDGQLAFANKASAGSKSHHGPDSTTSGQVGVAP